jgi:hypothetical protein
MREQLRRWCGYAEPEQSRFRHAGHIVRRAAWLCRRMTCGLNYREWPMSAFPRNLAIERTLTVQNCGDRSMHDIKIPLGPWQ